MEELSAAKPRKPRKAMSIRKLHYNPDENPLLEEVPLQTRQKRVYSQLIGKKPLMDTETGELLNASVVRTVEEKDDAEFVKIFSKGVAAAYNLTRTGHRVFQVILKQYENTPMQGGYADSIYLAWFDGGLSGQSVGMSEKTWQRGMQELLEKNFISPRTPNIFWVNPALFFKGDRVLMVREYRRKRNAANTMAFLETGNDEGLGAEFAEQFQKLEEAMQEE